MGIAQRKKYAMHVHTFASYAELRARASGNVTPRGTLRSARRKLRSESRKSATITYRDAMRAHVQEELDAAGKPAPRPARVSAVTVSG